MDGALVRRCLTLAAEALGQTRSAIDALNVYPVPDADTGTNLYRTLRSAADAVDAVPPGAGHGAVWRAAADGALLGACGNSGIIVSQLLRGLAEVCGPAPRCDGSVVARALGHAAGLARSAVSRPAEGTVLTVADAAARAVRGHGVMAGEVLGEVVAGAARAARVALGQTAGQLAVLAASGVVDSGAAGLREELDAMGDSLVVAGGAGRWSVHVHVPEAGPAIEAGLRAGRLGRITVTYLGTAGYASAAGADRRADESHVVLALCATAGLAALARSAGAEVLRYESSGVPSADELCAAVRPLGRRCIIVPDGDVTRAAGVEAAAMLAADGFQVRVVPVGAAARALPALAVHEPRAGFDADAAAMDRAAARMRCASVAASAPAAEVRTAVDALLAGGAEVLTLVTGADTPAGLVDWVRTRAGQLAAGAEIEWHAVAPAGVALLAGAE
jgi:hypothetical protein